MTSVIFIHGMFVTPLCWEKWEKYFQERGYRTLAPAWPEHDRPIEEQRKLYGAPLYPYLFYGRNPAYFRAAQRMFATMQQEMKRVPATLRALLNRRVAWWNGCEF